MSTHTTRESRVATIAALVLVNAFAVTGQATWAYANLGHRWYVAAGFAATLESISLYLTAQASAAMLANDKSAGLRLGAYTVGLLTGAMNYSAHAPDWRPNAMAIAFGMLSALSPWLWTIQSRRTHRDQLAEAGLIDPRTVKVTTAMWALYPGYAFSLLRLGVRLGTNHLPTLRAMHAERAAVKKLTPVDAVLYAYGSVGFDQHTARVWLSERGVLVDQATLDAASAGRPTFPQPPRAGNPVSPAPAGSVGLTIEDMHREGLAACKTNRDRIRLAFSVLGHYGQAEARAWLSERGYRVSRSDVNALAKAGASGALTGPSGAYPTLSGHAVAGSAN